MAEMEQRRGGHWPVNRWINPCVVSLNWSQQLRGGKSVRIQHPFWVLDYLQDAAYRIRVGSIRAPWQERAAQVVHLYPPWTEYWEWAADPGTLIRGGYIVFNLENDAFLRGIFTKSARYARIMDPDGMMGSHLKEGAYAVGQQSGDSAFWVAQGILCAVLAVLLKAQPLGSENWEVRAHQGSAPLGLVAQVEAYLKSRLVGPVTLNDLARALHLSRSSLSHRYKELTGTSPMQALLQLRIDQAKSLLVRGYKLDDIASQCGFYDAAHFSRLFQAKTGQTPRRFARTL